MPLLRYRCPACKNELESFKKAPRCNHGQEEEGHPNPVAVMERVLEAPSAKFMEPRDKEKGRSILKDQKKMLMERAKDHARLNDYHSFVQEHGTKMGKNQGWLREDGTIRKKVDES